MEQAKREQFKQTLYEVIDSFVPKNEKIFIAALKDACKAFYNANLETSADVNHEKSIEITKEFSNIILKHQRKHKELDDTKYALMLFTFLKICNSKFFNEKNIPNETKISLAYEVKDRLNDVVYINSSELENPTDKGNEVIANFIKETDGYLTKKIDIIDGKQKSVRVEKEYPTTLVWANNAKIELITRALYERGIIKSKNSFKKFLKSGTNDIDVPIEHIKTFSLLVYNLKNKQNAFEIRKNNSGYKGYYKHFEIHIKDFSNSPTKIRMSKIVSEIISNPSANKPIISMVRSILIDCKFSNTENII